MNVHNGNIHANRLNSALCTVNPTPNIAYQASHTCTKPTKQPKKHVSQQQSQSIAKPVDSATGPRSMGIVLSVWRTLFMEKPKVKEVVGLARRYSLENSDNTISN